MGRIVTLVTVANVLDLSKELRFDALVDTGASVLVLPAAWKERLGALQTTRDVHIETADQRIFSGEMGGPVRIQIEGFEPVHSDVLFIDMEPANGRYEPLLGHIVLQLSQVAVDLVGDRLVPGRPFDVK